MRRVAVAFFSLLAFAVPAGAAGWERVDVPAAAGEAYVYRSAAAFGDEGVWAVGYSFATVGGPLPFRALIERWNGHGWRRAPLPERATAARDLLFDVSAPGPARAWAVGSAAPMIGSSPTQPLVLRWDGARWSAVDGPAGLGGALTAVAAARNGIVWIAGEGRNPQTLNAIPRVWLRAGDAWEEVAFPAIPGCATSANGLPTSAELTDLASRGLRATWASGYCATPAGGERGFLARFDGTRWIPVLTPDALLAHGARGQLTGVAMAPDADVWAVGWSGDFSSSTPLAFRGSGGRVRPVTAPAQGTGAALRAVAAERGGAAVAAGAFARSTDSAPHPHLLGADGAGDLAVEPADPGADGNLYGIALSPSGAAWAVGASSRDDRGLVLRRTP